MDEDVGCILVWSDGVRLGVFLSQELSNAHIILLPELLHARIVRVHVDVDGVQCTILLIVIFAKLGIIWPDLVNVCLTLLGHDFLASNRGADDFLGASLGTAVKNVLAIAAHT